MRSSQLSSPRGFGKGAFGEKVSQVCRDLPTWLAVPSISQRRLAASPTMPLGQSSGQSATGLLLSLGSKSWRLPCRCVA